MRWPARRTVLAGAVALLLVGGVVEILLVRHHDQDVEAQEKFIHVSYAQIARIQAVPEHEGTSPPPLVPDVHEARDLLPVSMVRSQIPSPFPVPAQCDYTGSGNSVLLTITLKSGEKLRYLACAFPEELRPLYLGIINGPTSVQP